jgi:hypothetical protein
MPSLRSKGDTKTRKSRRVLELPTRAIQAFRTHHARQAAERLAAGECWQEHDLVFCREDGTPLDRWHVRKEFAKITKAARLGPETIYRHEIRPALTKGATAMNRILAAK